MTPRTGRIFFGLIGLVLVWIFVYWAWDPGRGENRPRISFDDLPVAAQTTGPREPAQPKAQLREPEPRVVARPPVQQPEQIRTPSVAPAQNPRVEAPRFRDYTVRSGDSFERIAKRQWGKKSYWSRIAQANPLKDPRRIKPGDVIRIPLDPGNVQGRDVSARPGGTALQAVGEQPQAKQSTPAPVIPEEPEPEDEIIEYTVKPGDTLSDIARVYYGSTGFAEFIFFSNQDRLDGPDDLRVGQKLVIPPIPAENEG